MTNKMGSCPGNMINCRTKIDRPEEGFLQLEVSSMLATLL